MGWRTGTPGLPQEVAFARRDRHVIDAGLAAPHQSIGIEFPLLIAMAAKPIAGIIVPLVLESHGDAVFVEGPELLDQPVIEFSGPFAAKKIDDRCAALEDFRAIAPAAVFGISERNAFWIASIP